VTIDPFAAHGVLIASLVLAASQSQQPDPLLLLPIIKKTDVAIRPYIIWRNESSRQGRDSLITYADGFIHHRLDPLARLDRTRTDSFRAAFAEQTSHTRLVSQTEPVGVLISPRKERKNNLFFITKIQFQHGPNENV
jgi:hypothetical protein